MKVLKVLVSGIGTVLLYLTGLFLIVGSVDIQSVMSEFSTRDVAQFLTSDQILAMVLSVLFVLFTLPLLQQGIRTEWLGTLLLGLSLTATLLLAVGVLTFEDRQLLVITSALFGSIVISIVPLSAIALLGVRKQKRQLEKVSSLQKLQLQQGEKLLLKSTKQSLSRYISIAFVITYGGFLYLYSMYLEVSIREVVDSVLYSLVFIVAVILFTVGYVRSTKRLFQ